ncbi:ribonuclease H-like domain-containing protein [Tanacetum coccineum]
MVDNLPKIVWCSIHHGIALKYWLLQSKRLLLTSPEQTATGKDMTNPPPWRLPFLVAVEDLMIVAEQGFKDYKYSDISIHQRVKVLSRLQRSVEVKAKQEKDIFRIIDSIHLFLDPSCIILEKPPLHHYVIHYQNPIIKKGEYDLWCMKMRQYIAITDHILWDIITNGDQATTEPASSSGQPSAPKTSIVVNAKSNMRKLFLHIALCNNQIDISESSMMIKIRRSLWAAIKARFGGNKESKKMQKNLLKQQFETFVVGAREELDSAYDRFQNIISMLELYDAKVSCEDANLKFLRSLPSVWHVVATMIRGQPGLDELDFDDLYNNLKVYEHELKGASSSNSQSIAFMSAEIKGSTSRQSTADDKSEIITKGYAQASSSKLKETLNSSFNSDEIICSFFAQQASMPETHDDEDLLQIDDDAMEEIDIRWQVAMITARIRKFMRKTGRPIDLKPKNGITFDKSKIECFNCQKLGHFARECKFAKYQANRANGSKEKRIVPIEDSNSKALVAKDSQGEIDWTKEFDDDPVTFAMVALNGIEEDDWSIEIDADHVDLGQDGLGVFDWSEEADNAPVALALMATSSTDSSNSEVPYCSNCSKSYKKLLNDYQTEKDNFQRARLEIQGYQLSLESLEVIIRTHEKNEYAWGDKYEQMEYDLKMRDWKLGEKQKEFDNVIKERDELKEKLEKWSNATLLQTEILNKQKVLSDKTCIGFGVEYSSSEESNNSSGDETLTGPLYENFKREKAYKAVPPPTGTIIPPRADVAFTGIDELAIRNKVINKQNSESSGTNHESCESKNRDDLIKNKEQTQNTVKSNIDRNKVIIEDWVDSDDEEVPLGVSEIKKQTVLKSETSSETKSPRSKDSFGQRSRRRGLGYRNGKVCFVCYSPDHLIKDCNLHERNLKQTQKPKPLETQGSRDSRSVWNNTSRVNHRNFSSDYRHPHQRRSFIPSAVLTREGLKSTVRSKMSQAVPSQSTASAFYQNTARPKVSKAVLSQSTARPYFPRPVFSTSTGRPYYPRMDNVRPRASSSSPPTGFFNTRTVDRPKSPKPIIKSKWVKKESTAGTQAVLPQTKGEKRESYGNFVMNPRRKEESQEKGTIKTSCIDDNVVKSTIWNDEPMSLFEGEETACKRYGPLKEELILSSLAVPMKYALVVFSPDVIQHGFQQFWSTSEVCVCLMKSLDIEAKQKMQRDLQEGLQLNGERLRKRKERRTAGLERLTSRNRGSMNMIALQRSAKAQRENFTEEQQSKIFW